MNEISLIRGAMRSLVEGPRRRALESDSQRAREVFEDYWTRELAPHHPGAQVVRWHYQEGLGVAQVRTLSQELCYLIKFSGFEIETVHSFHSDGGK
jgi:hypothetical protein